MASHTHFWDTYNSFVYHKRGVNFIGGLYYLGILFVMATIIGVSVFFISRSLDADMYEYYDSSSFVLKSTE